MKHSIILGSYNRPRYVVDAIRSVLRQDHEDLELLITDDGSNEETLASIRRVVDGRCQVFCGNHDEGPREANVRAVLRINAALPFVTGDIVHYLPDDDIFLNGRLATFDEAFTQLRGVSMISAGLRMMDESGALLLGHGIHPTGPITDPVCVLDQTQVAHRRACLERVPLWPTENIQYAADGFFFKALVDAGFGPIVPIPHYDAAAHRLHPYNLIKTQDKTTDVREPP